MQRRAARPAGALVLLHLVADPLGGTGLVLSGKWHAPSQHHPPVRRRGGRRGGGHAPLRLGATGGRVRPVGGWSGRRMAGAAEAWGRHWTAWSVGLLGRRRGG